MNLSAKIAFTASAALLAGAAILFQGGLTKEDGAEYLREKEYTNVTGGDRKFLSICGKSSIAREYQALDINGQAVKKTVCWSLFGKHAPLLESHEQPPKLKP